MEEDFSSRFELKDLGVWCDGAILEFLGEGHERDVLSL
jgi:hypothetical protein